MKLKYILSITIILFLCPFSFSDDNKWEKGENHIYFSFSDLSYISTLNKKSTFSLDIFSCSFSTYPTPNKLYFGTTALYLETDFNKTNIALLPLNMYLNTFDINRVNEIFHLFNFFYIHSYPINFLFDSSSFSYNPYIVIGNETAITQDILPGTFGIGIEYKVDQYVANTTTNNYYNNIRVNLFYKIGSLLPME